VSVGGVSTLVRPDSRRPLSVTQSTIREEVSLRHEGRPPFLSGNIVGVGPYSMMQRPRALRKTSYQPLMRKPVGRFWIESRSTYRGGFPLPAFAGTSFAGMTYGRATMCAHRARTRSPSKRLGVSNQEADKPKC
jgi:hypothetical protein